METIIHSFVVRIWLEEPAQANQRASWRGHITHVVDGERMYLQDIDSIGVFIANYLEEMGVNLGPRWRLHRWLKRTLRKRA